MGETFTIGMGEYAYLNQEIVNETGVTSLQTPGIASCYGVALENTISGNVALIHADINKINQIDYAVQQILENTDSQYNSIHLYTNKDILHLENSDEELEELQEILELTPETNVSTHINDTVRDLKIKYSEGIKATNIEKTEINRLNTEIELKNKEAIKTEKVIYNPLNKK